SPVEQHVSRKSLLQRLKSLLEAWRSAPERRAPAVSTDRTPAELAPSAATDSEDMAATPAAHALRVLEALDGSASDQVARAVAALRATAGTALERRALGACQAAHARGAAPPQLLCLAAELLGRRGQAAEALRLLEGLEDPAAWLLEAELCAEQGQHERALALSERAPAYDTGAPGARLRVPPWPASVGGQSRVGPEPTTRSGA